MKTIKPKPIQHAALRGPVLWFLALALTGLAACGTTAQRSRNKDDFFTSGSRESDQRASQRMAKAEQLSGSGEGAGEKGVKPAVTSGADGQAAQVAGKLALFDRLGGEKGITAIVGDFTPRVLQDPRVNWSRKDVKGALAFLSKSSKALPWEASEQNVAALKQHLVQFIVLATGGPVHYDGKEIKPVHAGMKIGNPEFDAALGDLKASLDRLKIPNKEQKELLSIIESTRPQIVTVR